MDNLTEVIAAVVGGVIIAYQTYIARKVRPIQPRDPRDRLSIIKELRDVRAELHAMKELQQELFDEFAKHLLETNGRDRPGRKGDR